MPLIYLQQKGTTDLTPILFSLWGLSFFFYFYPRPRVSRKVLTFFHLCCTFFRFFCCIFPGLLSDGFFIFHSHLTGSPFSTHRAERNSVPLRTSTTTCRKLRLNPLFSNDTLPLRLFALSFALIFDCFTTHISHASSTYLTLTFTYIWLYRRHDYDCPFYFFFVSFFIVFVIKPSRIYLPRILFVYEEASF